MLMPNCLSSVRCTSATVTLSITCSSPSTVSRLMTSLVSLPQAAAWFWVWLLVGARGPAGLSGVDADDRARVGAATDGRRADALVGGDELAGDVGGALGVERRAHRAAQDDGLAGHLGLDVRARHEPLQNRRRGPEMSAPTRSPASGSADPWCRRRRRWFAPWPLAIRNTRLEDCTTASTFSGSATSTSLSSKGNCTSSDLPWPSVARLVSGKFPLAGMRRTECWRLSLGSRWDPVRAPRARSPKRRRQPAAAPAVRLEIIRMVCQPSCRP